MIRGAHGGPLAPLASQLNQDVSYLQGQRIEDMIGQLADVVREALARPASGAIAAPARTISNLPVRNPHFTGRGELLALLADLLGPGQPAVVAVHGLGGIGKTQLAQEYARTHQAEYGIIWWLRASTPVELAADFTGLARALGLDADPSRKDLSEAVRSELAGRSDWLLVLDNASDAELIRACLPAGPGHVLITSRMRLWTGLARTCAVDVLAPDEAVGYLAASTGRDDPEITDLAAQLGCLPLALAQAAGYITVHGCSAARYLELYRVAAQRMLAAGPPPPGYPKTVATTWLLNFRSLSGPAIELLRLVSFLAPDAIPLDLLFAAAPVASLSAALADAVTDPLAREAAIGELVSASLVSRLDVQAVQVHGLVQEITRSRLGKRDAAVWAQRAVELVRAAIPDQPDLREHWDTMSSLAPHAQSVAMRVGPHQRAAYPAAMILIGLGTYLVEQEQFETARGLLSRALELVLFADPKRRLEAEILYRLGAALQGLHDSEAAGSAAKRELTLVEADRGTSHPAVLQPLLLLVWTCTERGDHESALAHLDRVAEIYAKTQAAVPPDLAWSVLVMLGEGMRAVGEYEAALHNLNGAMAVATECFGPDSHQVAQVQYAIAWVRRDLGEEAAAHAQLGQAIDAIGAQFGPEHPFTGRLSQRLALWRASGSVAEGGRAPAVDGHD